MTVWLQYRDTVLNALLDAVGGAADGELLSPRDPVAILATRGASAEGNVSPDCMSSSTAS